MVNPKTRYEHGDSIMAKAIHVTSLAECTRRFGRENKTKMVHGKVLSVYTKQTATGRNSRYVRGQFDLGGGSLKVMDINVRSIKAPPKEPEAPSNAVGAEGAAEAAAEAPLAAIVDDTASARTIEIDSVDIEASLEQTQDFFDCMEINTENDKKNNPTVVEEVENTSIMPPSNEKQNEKEQEKNPQMAVASPPPSRYYCTS